MNDKKNYRLLRSIDPNRLYPGLMIFDPHSHRDGEIIKIEYHTRELPVILVVFDGADRPVDAYDYPEMLVSDGN